MRKIFLLLIVAVLAVIVAIKLNLVSFMQTVPAQAPGVQVTSNGITASGGQAPKFEVRAGTVEVGTRTANVAVPVPTISVNNPGANQAAPAPAPTK